MSRWLSWIILVAITSVTYIIYPEPAGLLPVDEGITDVEWVEQKTLQTAAEQRSRRTIPYFGTGEGYVRCVGVFSPGIPCGCQQNAAPALAGTVHHRRKQGRRWV